MNKTPKYGNDLDEFCSTVQTLTPAITNYVLLTPCALFAASRSSCCLISSARRNCTSRFFSTWRFLSASVILTCQLSVPITKCGMVLQCHRQSSRHTNSLMIKSNEVDLITRFVVLRKCSCSQNNKVRSNIHDIESLGIRSSCISLMPTKIRFANREISRVFRIFHRVSLNLNIWNSLPMRSGSGDYTDWEDSICFCL